MTYPMTHLCIAYNILNTTPQIKEPCDFLLGALAPDSVHFRDNYNSDMKKISHLCVGNEKWGEITNNQEWLENALAFLNANKYEKNSDFIHGYCAHIITDIQTNIKMWTPIRLGNEDTKIYGKEVYNIDYELYIAHPARTIIWQMLENATGYDILNIVAENEIDKMKNSIIHC